jgi:membrane-anchored protein YejM (alkaline phosphatase superfamily)
MLVSVLNGMLGIVYAGAVLVAVVLLFFFLSIPYLFGICVLFTEFTWSDLVSMIDRQKAKKTFLVFLISVVISAICWVIAHFSHLWWV